MTVLTFAPSLTVVEAPAPDDLAAVVAGRAALLVPDDQHRWRLPTLAEVPGVTVAEPLGTMNGRSVWLATLDSPAQAGTSAGLTTLAWLDVIGLAPAAVASVAARAIHVSEWRGSHRFCGACGGPFADVPGMIARKCGACGRFEHIKAQPVALVAIWRPGASGTAEVLLARHTYGAAQYWALVGGYLDPAESLEEAAAREAAEEVGLEVTDLRYYGSEGWGLSGPSITLAVFLARAGDPSAEPVIDGHEIAEARYFPIDRLPRPTPPRPLIAARLLADLPALLRGREG